ncbi:uncharacterized protein BJ212DRAFT_1231080, partial [Suillus subaureus]
IQAVQHLRNGGLMIDLDSEQLASWLKGSTGCMLLETHLDLTACICDMTYAIVVQFLLVTYEIKREGFTHHIKAEDYLPPNSIASIQWIKPPQCCTREQCTAFTLLQIKDNETAN